MKYLYLAVGGATGTILRYLLSTFYNERSPYFPMGTFLVNLSGSLVIGFLAGLCLERMSSEWRIFLFAGLLGGFTTFSSFALESLTLIKNQQTFTALLYAASSTIFGILLASIGFIAGNFLNHRFFPR